MDYSEKFEGARRYVRYKEGAEIYGLCQSTFEKRAKESGAIIKLGKSVLVDRKVFDNYLDLFRVPAER